MLFFRDEKRPHGLSREGAGASGGGEGRRLQTMRAGTFTVCPDLAEIVKEGQATSAASRLGLLLRASFRHFAANAPFAQCFLAVDTVSSGVATVPAYLR